MVNHTDKSSKFVGVDNLSRNLLTKKETLDNNLGRVHFLVQSGTNSLPPEIDLEQKTAPEHHIILQNI